MAILNVVTSVTGLVGVTPRIIYIDTNDTLATVTTAGYLNAAQANGAGFRESDMALVTIKSSPSAASIQVAWLEISYSSGDWSLVASSSSIPLANGKILVGNASGVATAVTMSGDATLANTGALTVAANAITTTKIINAAVTKAKLETALQPAGVIKYAAKSTQAGGSATVTITATGVAATDLAFVNIESSANAVEIQKVTPTANTITVLCSGDPGASVFSWQAVTLTP